MSEVIYADVLIAINIFVTYLLLAASSLLSAVPAKRWRMLLAALLGGVSALLIFLPPSPWWLWLLVKTACSAALVWTAFGFQKWRRYLRCFGAFFGVNFGFAGVMLALWFTVKPNGMFYQNGAVYFDIGLVTFILLASFCYALIRGLVFLLRRRHPQGNDYRATIHMTGRSITLPALHDSGNTLTDGFTGAPVMVAEFDALRTFLPAPLLGFFRGETGTEPAEHLTAREDLAWRSRLREIPFHSLGQKGLLPAFRTDRVVVRSRTGETVTPGAIVAVTRDSLSDGSCPVILHANMLEEK
ncbi:MAG: sigma-E processing peptidase SpoIIGA [Oscillospiraceae bacterium]|nr:sigma-E processing peptidase SpoIIGA [Oscillospiraceae bacterium]